MRKRIVWMTASAGLALLSLLGRSAEAQRPPQFFYLPGITVSATAAKPDETNLHTVKIGPCEVLLWITADGYIRLAQVTKSSGYSRLDDASLHAVLGGKKLAPSAEAEAPVDSWAILPITYELTMGKSATGPDVAVEAARLAPNQTMPLKAPDYPKVALDRAEHGESWVHVEVADSGQVLSVKIARSAGSSDLDNAALEVIRSAHFSPAFSAHKPIAATADVVVIWVLPETTPSAPPSDH